MARWGAFLLLIVLLVVGFEFWVQLQIDGYLASHPEADPESDLDAVYPGHVMMIVPLLVLGTTFVGLFGFVLALGGWLSARRRMKATPLPPRDG